VLRILPPCVFAVNNNQNDKRTSRKSPSSVAASWAAASPATSPTRDRSAAAGHRAQRGQPTSNKIVNDALAFALKSNPSPIYDKRFAKRISTGNFDDDLPKIKDCDWIIEVVVERLDIKQQVLANVEKLPHARHADHHQHQRHSDPRHRSKAAATISAKHFCGTHFFNPPRYLPLLELIPGPDTDPAVLASWRTTASASWARSPCGQGHARLRGQPHRRVRHHGRVPPGHRHGPHRGRGGPPHRPVIGHPKSATFRTADVVGLDTLVNVAKGVKENCPRTSATASSPFRTTCRRWWRRTCSAARPARASSSRTAVTPKGEILSLDLKTLEYKPQVKPKFATLDAAKKVDDLRERTKLVYNGTDKAGEFYRRSLPQRCSPT
jgi:3-hydroxyacyl-CoA dehydrogenase